MKVWPSLAKVFSIQLSCQNVAKLSPIIVYIFPVRKSLSAWIGTTVDIRDHAVKTWQKVVRCDPDIIASYLFLLFSVLNNRWDTLSTVLHFMVFRQCHGTFCLVPNFGCCSASYISSGARRPVSLAPHRKCTCIARDCPETFPRSTWSTALQTFAIIRVPALFTAVHSFFRGKDKG